jgi:hypothetical protein
MPWWRIPHRFEAASQNRARDHLGNRGCPEQNLGCRSTSRGASSNSSAANRIASEVRGLLPRAVRRVLRASSDIVVPPSLRPRLTCFRRCALAPCRRGQRRFPANSIG